MVFGPVVGPTRPGPHGPAAVERKWSHVWLSQGFEREKYLHFNKSTKLGRIGFTTHKCKPKNLELRHSWHWVWQTVTELDENPSDEVRRTKVRQLHTRLHSEVDSSSWKWSDCVSEDDTAVWRQRNIRSRCCIFEYFCREEAHTERKESDLRQNHVGHHRTDKQGRGKVSSQQNNETTFIFLYGKLNKCFHFVEVVKQSHKQTQ